MTVSPLVPAHVDLRDFAYMPLDVARLRDSDTTAISSGEEFRAAVMLWCACWHQVPAASLPNDDRLLARLAGYGRDVDAWLAVRSMALRGFVLCADDRLYHTVIAEKAIEAWNAKERQRRRTATATATRLGLAADAPRDVPRNEQRKVERDEQRNEQRNVERDEQRNEHQERRIGNIPPLSPPPPGGEATEVCLPARGVPSSEPAKPKRSEPKATRLPPDWRPSADDRAYAARLGFDAARIDRIGEDFRGYWLAKGGSAARKVDWSLTWQGWCRREADRVMPGKAATGPPPVRIPTFEEVVAKARAEHENRSKTAGSGELRGL